MAWFGKEKQAPASQKEAVVQSEALARLGHLDPQYASSARTRAVRKNDTLCEYRRAEKMPNGKWKVVKVEVYDYSKLHEQAAQSLNLEGAPNLDKKVAVDVTSVKVTNAEGRERDEFSFIEAMAYLANLEYDVIKKNSGYAYADENEVIESAKFARIDETNAFIQQDFSEIEHFVIVSEREGVIWTADAVPRISKHGRLIEDGTYMTDDVARANGAREGALKNPPAKGAPQGILADAFMAVSNKNTLEATLRAYDVIADMDQLFEAITELTKSYSKYLEDTSSEWMLEQVKESIRACERKCDDVNESIGAYVDRYREVLLRVHLSANVSHMQSMMEEIRLSPEAVKVNKPLIENLQRENAGLIETSGLTKNFETIAEAAVAPADLKAMVESYNQYRLEWRKKVESRPEDAMETSKTFADKRKAPASKK